MDHHVQQHRGLEFVPGRRTGLVGTPSVVGAGGWQAIKTIS
ncbi:hypothetical protein ACFVY9_35710 [Streptomyces sp. NPDC059544]